MELRIPSMVRSARWSVMTAAAVVATAVSSHALRAADPTLNAQGEMGRTSYITLPFVSDVCQLSWGSNNGLAPGNLCWDSGTWFTNSTTMQAARSTAAGLTAKGVVPFSGAQRWEDTYMAAQAPLANEPSYVASDRASMAGRTDYQAWAAWEQAHSNLFILKADGSQQGQTVGSWFGNYGHISPLMPLPSTDWPTGMTNVTYGQWYAYKWGQTAQKSGAYGVLLSDFADSQPYLLSYQTGFNPEIIAAFSKSLGNASIPSAWGSTVPQQAAYINAHLYPQWTDNLCLGYANFFKSLATELTNNTGHQGLVLDQGGDYPSLRRLKGVDDRIIAQNVPSRNFIQYAWDSITMAPERSGQSTIWGMGGSVIAAAREPSVRIGANLSANDNTFWQAVDRFWNHDATNYASATFANTSPALQERGLKELKREWLEYSWAHIADRQGNTRRALCTMSRDYWDAGGIDPKVAQLIQSIVPARPFGFAIYYSVDMERKAEASVPTQGASAAYFNPDILMNFKNGGGVVNYYVSDAALATPDALANLAANARPAAWLVLDRPELMSQAERDKLTAIAPILTSLSQAQTFADAPLKFSAGLTGDGFYDQDNRLIILATNQAATDLTNASMTLRGLTAGQYQVTDLFSNAHFTFSATGASTTVPIDVVTRWDTRVFAVTVVPEPTAAVLGTAAGSLLLMRRPGKGLSDGHG